ncbi:hypothetical protein ACX83H_32015 [Burkholderia pseudomallei]|uniref:hypothetical protein n=2 Tax=Burkholderia pseudomallei TaxID=28450 RepID=UPI000F06A47E|nr:hypothetical protein [Burkholderia pseudomallei]MCV9916663.1 hypothetical protein [Burkholderia pseudomallei]MCV9973817.1 hypothetical protein [Burkholderia pseudomallei]MCW0072648.1 hypothetical protein [Burkholderia pseudomallei]VBH31716.1 Uncharacterised protein [Burkholderia pseudomallei]
MARPARSDSEKRRGGMRAAALLHVLATRIGAGNPHQFAARFDEKFGMLTSRSGKWRLNFNGEKPLSQQQRKLLTRLDADADALYEDGPASLWKAMWGQLNELRSIVSAELGKWETLDMVLAEFEADLLLAELKHAPLALAHLAKAVALYRLHQEIEAVVPIGLDGGGICRCLRLCLDNDPIQQELALLGVQQAVDAELTSWIVSRTDMEFAWAPADERWSAVAARLDWVN